MTKIEIVKKILGDLEEVEFAYLFGSYAKNTSTQNSDIDIAVYLKHDCNTFDVKLKIHHQLEIRLNMDVDLLVLNKVHNYNLLQEIFDSGILIKDSTPEDARIVFELNKHHEILDYREFQRIIDAA